jgi:hypothetical protein
VAEELGRGGWTPTESVNCRGCIPSSRSCLSMIRSYSGVANTVTKLWQMWVCEDIRPVMIGYLSKIERNGSNLQSETESLDCDTILSNCPIKRKLRLGAGHAGRCLLQVAWFPNQSLFSADPLTVNNKNSGSTSTEAFKAQRHHSSFEINRLILSRRADYFHTVSACVVVSAVYLCHSGLGTREAGPSVIRFCPS